MEHQVIIPFEQQEIAATLHYPKHHNSSGEQQSKWPIVIVCHGFIGNRIGVDRLFVEAARDLSREGFLVLRFDFLGCGESTGSYGAYTVDDMVRQTRSVLDYGLGIDSVDLTRVTLLGHSLGGAVSVLTAAKDSRVTSLVLWSAVARPLNDIVQIIGKPAYQRAQREGAVDFQGYALQLPFLESLAIAHPMQALKKFEGDVLLVHGGSDETIPSDYCFLYQKCFWLRSGGSCDKEIILRADHTYSSREARDQLLKTTRNWLLTLEKRKNEWFDWTI